MGTQHLGELSDEILLEQIQHGDDDAIGTVMLKYERLLRKIINGHGITHPQDEDDVFQNICFAFVTQCRKDITAIREVDKWLKQVARNKCADFGRAAQKQRRALEVAVDLRRAAVDREAHRGIPDDVREAVANETLEAMGAKYVAVAELWRRRYTSAEIGEQLGIPENTVKSRKTAIRKRVAEALRELSPPAE